LHIELRAAQAGDQGLPLEELLHDVEEHHIVVTKQLLALYASFDRSLNARSPLQQRLFAGLSLFAGDSFPRDGALALAVAARTGIRQTTQAKDDVEALVTAALVKSLPDKRLRLHALLRDYAARRFKKCSQANKRRLGEAMFDYWLDYAQQHSTPEWFNALEAESAGLLGALAWAHEQEQHQRLLALVKILAKAWRMRGRRTEEIQMLHWTEQAAQALDDAQAVRWALHHRRASNG
jgi:hypothetical protein